MTCSNRFARGFSLIELVVGLAVFTIVGMLAVPMYGSMMETSRTRAAAFSLVSALNFARSEAVKRNAPVSVLPIGSGWQDGWEVESSGAVLSTNQTRPDLAVSAPVATVDYQPNGRLTTPGVLLFTISATTGYTRCVLIDPGGRASIRRGERNDGSCV